MTSNELLARLNDAGLSITRQWLAELRKKSLIKGTHYKWVEGNVCYFENSVPVLTGRKKWEHKKKLPEE